MKRAVRISISLLLLPLTIAAVWRLFDLIIDFGSNINSYAAPFWLGLISYFVFQIVFFKPIRTYVFGHELTHALAGLLSGADLKSFKVSSSGGSVVLSKANIWITLAPYFIPIYTVFLILIYKSTSLIWFIQSIQPYFLFAVGFSLSFHFSLTFFALSQGQSDINRFGIFLSIIIIILINVVILSLLLEILFPQYINYKEFILGILSLTLKIWQIIIIKMKKLWLSFHMMK